MVTFQWLRTEIGTVGFVGRGGLGGSNPFGLVTYLGYEKRLGRLNFSVGYDMKYVFAQPALTIKNVSFGVGFHF